MNWSKIQEDAVKILLGMVLAALGAAIGWNLRTTLLHERELASKDAAFKIMQHEQEIARKRDEELITMMAEEIKKLKEAVEKSCAHLAEESSRNEEPLPHPEPKRPKKDPKETFNKFFPPEQRTDDYQRILRDKFEQRTNQMDR